MNILFVLVPLALVLALAAVTAFRWAVRDGQFDDVDTPAIRVLLDDVAAPTASGEHTGAEHTGAKNTGVKRAGAALPPHPSTERSSDS